eukprot:m51a1_g8118 hypothetical protein (322) ;mRNA; r:147172-148779
MTTGALLDGSRLSSVSGLPDSDAFVLPDTFLLASRICGLASLGVAGLAIAGHLAAYAMPSVQRFYVRVLLALPAFALSRAAVLRLGAGSAAWCDVPASLFESYAIASFYWLMVATCGDGKCFETCVPEQEARGASRVRRWLLRHSCALVMQLIPVRVISMVVIAAGRRWLVVLLARIASALSLTLAMLALLSVYRHSRSLLGPAGVRAVAVFAWLKAMVAVVLLQRPVVDYALRGRAGWEELDAGLALCELLGFALAAWWVFGVVRFVRLEACGAPREFSVKSFSRPRLLGFALVDALLAVWRVRGTGCRHFVQENRSIQA